MSASTHTNEVPASLKQEHPESFRQVQGRKEEAVIRHFRLGCVAQWLLQRASASESASERFAFAKRENTCESGSGR
jgi:hypothetical protein